jgi:hypothetical protein
MPVIDEFNGIKITIYYPPREHNPPHFHAKYGNDEASYNIVDLNVIAGKLGKPQHDAVTEWATHRQRELLSCWEQAQRHERVTRMGREDNLSS